MSNIDQNFYQLQMQQQKTVSAITGLAQKLQAAAAAGDPNAREWLLELKSVTLEFQQEQNQVALLLQAVHNAAAQQPQQPQYQQAPPQPQYQQPVYQQPVYQQPAYPQRQGGGFMQTMGQGLAMGAGFGIGEEIIDGIFDW